MAAPATRKYEDFDPLNQIIDEKDCETIQVSVPGFKREQLRVQLTSTNLVRISGEREIEAGKCVRFLKEFPIKSNIDRNKISAKFEFGMLNVKLPKLIITEDQPDNKLPYPQTPKPEAAADKPQVQGSVEQKTTEVTSKSDGSNQQPSVVQKSTEKDEPKSKGTSTVVSEEEESENYCKWERKVSNESGKSATRQENYQVTAADLASKLKMSRRVFFMVLFGFAAVGLGLYATNFIRTYSASSEFSG